MSDIFVSYKREDATRVKPLVAALEQSGFTVWWDRSIPGGVAWRQSIDEQLANAKCVIVAWSRLSVSAAGDFVHDEAGRAKARDVLLPVLIDRVTPPLGFGGIQALDLAGWRGSTKDPRFEDVRAAATAIVHGRPRPKPQAPAKRLRNAVSAGTLTACAAVTLAFALDVANMRYALCRIPGVRAACTAYGFGGVPTRAEEELWVTRAPGDCSVLTAYLERFPTGAFAEEARSRLQGASAVTRETWRPGMRTRLLAVRPRLEAFPREDTARADTLARAREDARLACSDLDTGEFRLVSAEAKPVTWRCAPRRRGVGCGFDGQAICNVLVRHLDERKLCP